MLHINLIVLGKLKEKYWVEAQQEYLKRLSAFCKIQITELREEGFSEKDNSETTKEKEAEKILKILPKENFIIVLDSTGTQFSSENFSKKITELEQANIQNNITFIIGGPLGLHKKILDLADLKLSFSKMTFTHQMVKIFLLEQIYRGFMIKENRKYHW